MWIMFKNETNVDDDDDDCPKKCLKNVERLLRFIRNLNKMTELDTHSTGGGSRNRCTTTTRDRSLRSIAPDGHT